MLSVPGWTPEGARHINLCCSQLEVGDSSLNWLFHPLLVRQDNREGKRRKKLEMQRREERQKYEQGWSTVNSSMQKNDIKAASDVVVSAEAHVPGVR